MKKLIQIIATAFGLLFGNAAFSQVDSVYIVKGDSVMAVYATTEVDSVIFYRPNISSETFLVKYGEGVTDIDGNNYQSVIIGEQEWMAENLRTTKYSDGTAIPNETVHFGWENLTSGAWCHYNNDNQYDTIYGKLYNWYAVETGKLCPTEWHVPTDAEWTVLTDYLADDGHSATEGTALKAISGWNDYEGQSGNGTDDYGWLGLPGGSRGTSSYFPNVGQSGFWWSSSQSNTYDAWNRYLGFNNDLVNSYNYNKRFGFSVRCLRDVESTQTTSQVRLKNGETPLDIYQSGVSIDSIIGKTYQGGIIAYLDTLDGTGLIAAPTDQGTSEWGCHYSSILGADGTAIGTGRQNTADILAGCSDTSIAAYLCDTLILGGYSDWFLPSKDELNILYQNIGPENALGLGNVGGFASNYYWSSTEYVYANAWAQYFDYGAQFGNSKSDGSNVRAVRAF